jgi:hypothetical protein
MNNESEKTEISRSHIIQIIKNATKLKGKYLPITEESGEKSKILRIKALYNLTEIEKNFYLFLVRNYIKKPKLRYFLGISLASQSSDFLVSLVKDFATNNALKLIQYPIYPRSFRINLLLLRELKNVNDFSETINLFKELYKKYRKKIEKIINLVEIE